MSQVKNLRAMFEGKGDTSPPDRGRSSGASTPVQGAANGVESPRPLSKVRTNFVAIEKDGRIGLKRDPSHESSVSRRRLSMDTDAESVSTVPDKASAASEEVARGTKPFLHEPIPESPRQPAHTDKTPVEEVGAVTDKPSVNPDKKVDQEEPAPSLQPAEPAPASPTKETKPTTPPTAVNGKSKVEKSKEPAPAAPAKANAPKKTTTRPNTISTKSSTIKPPAKSPSAAKTPTSATHKPEQKPAAKAHEKPAPRKEARPASRASPSLARPTAASATKKPQPLKPTPSDTGFVKPKPKSPTKPVALPASLMAPTASSGAKTGRGVRPSASTQNLKVPARSPSRASVGAAGASGTAGKTIKRQSSTISRSRPSLGPPPKKAADQPATKKDAPVDEGFLARMMRPTQASSSKTHEKAPITPPRKTAKRPSSAGTDPASRRESSIKAPGSAKKPVKKHTEAKGVVKPATPEQPTVAVSPPPAEENTGESAKSETSQAPVDTIKEAEVTIPVEEAKKSDPEPLPVEEAKVEATQSQVIPEEPIEEIKEEEVRPATPEQPKEEAKPIEVAETPAAEKVEEASEKPATVESKEEAPAPEPETETKETSDVVPLLEEDSAQPPAVEETQETAAAPEPEAEAKTEVIPLLEKDTAPIVETESDEKKPAEDEGTTKIDTKIDTKEESKEEPKIDTGKEEDITAEEQTGEEKKQEAESVAKSD